MFQPSHWVVDSRMSIMLLTHKQVRREVLAGTVVGGEHEERN